MTPLGSLLRGGPRELKATYLFGGGQGFRQPDFWAGPEVFATATGGYREAIGDGFEQAVEKAYKRSGVVFACVQARALPFSEARFLHQRLDNGRPGELFWSPSLTMLEQPWRNGTTGELLYRMEQDASLAGNSYWTPVDGRLRRLRPTWVTIVAGVLDDPEASPFELNADVLGYIYEPRTAVGRRSKPVFLTPDRVVHYSPTPDPDAQWRGMSWLTPILPEVSADKAATAHKLKYFENGTVSNQVVVYDKTISPDAVKRHAELFSQQHAGVDNAYKVIHLGGGADMKALGADLKQIDFKLTQGAGETRIAAAAGVGSIIARFSEGLAGSSLNQGNYAAAKRQFGDMTIRPLWRIAAASLQKLAPGGDRSRLWYDPTDIEFLKDDRKDAADIEFTKAQTIRQLVEAGFTPKSAVIAVQSENMALLEHTGKTSVQLHDPNESTSEAQ